MKFLLMTTLLILLTIFTGSVILADEPFSNVPAGHWAYGVISLLENEGVSTGYPEGTFSGKNPVTRCEFAMVTYRIVPQLDDYAKNLSNTKVPFTPVDLDNLNRLIDEFNDELESLGVDASALHKNVSDFIDILKKKSNSASSDAATESGSNPEVNYYTPVPVDPNIVSSYIPYYKINNSETSPNQYLSIINSPLAIDGNIGISETNPLYLYLTTPFSVAGKISGNIQIGEIPFEFSKWTLNNSELGEYISGDLYENLNVPPLGTAVTFGTDRLKITGAFLDGIGQLLLINDNKNNETAGKPFKVLNATLLGPGGSKVGMNLISSNSSVGNNKVFSTNVNANLFNSLNLSASWAQSNFTGIAKEIKDGSAWETRVGIPISKINLGFGYSSITSGFMAPGYWNRIGDVFNVTDIQGPALSLNVPFTNSLSLLAGYEKYEQISDPSPGMNRRTYDRFLAGVRYSLTSKNKIDLGFEKVLYTPGFLNADTQSMMYFNMGVGHNFTPNASVKFFYQISDYNDWSFKNFAENAKTGLAVGQVSVKF